MTQNDKHWQERSDAWVKAQHDQRIKKEKEKQYERPINKFNSYADGFRSYGYNYEKQFYE